uniref:Chitin synthase ChsE (EC) n=1 Tax=Ganoderma boninense TaxID=34458 RepID=A0A5K1K109_9APHY|nr:Chitin synthase ChsE (EC [Ganoderma boninense]
MSAAASQTFPITRFAAVIDVQYASSNDRDPIPYFAPGGVLLSELAPGEFGLVITGHSYSVTIVALNVTHRWKIVSDGVHLEVRVSPWAPGEQLHGETWLYLRFKKCVVYSDFNRALWDVFWRAQSKAQQLQDSLDDIGYASPSNFTRHCRQYLGEDYFERLPDSGSEGYGSDDTRSDDERSYPDWSDEAEGSTSNGGEDSDVTAVEAP